MSIFDKASFDNFNTAPRGKRNASLELAVHEARRFVDAADHWLCIFGGVGLGKTHLCYAIKNHLRSRRNRVNLDTFRELIAWLRQPVSVNYERKLEAYLQVDFLIVDDVESLVLPTEVVDLDARNRFMRILEYRAQQGLPTMLSSWQDPSGLFPNLTKHMSDPDKCVTVKMIGEDYRRIPRGER